MDEQEVIELLIAFLPETIEGWLAVAIMACLVLSLVLPAPSEDCHPAVKFGHRLICILGMGAGKLKSAGKIGNIGSLFRRKR